MDALASSFRALNAVAMGEAHAGLVIRGAALANVYTGEVQEGTDIAVAGSRVAYVGPDASRAIGPGTRVRRARGLFAVPGMADPHVHIDQLVMPREFAARAALRGVTSLFADPIDVVSVAGARGLGEFLRQCEGAAARVFSVVPGGLPVDRRFSTSRALTPAQEAAALRRDGVIGLGEVFSWTRVTSRDPATMRQLARMLGEGCVINGHTAGASGRKLQAYVASGILSCHEPVDYAQAIERLRLGMWVMAREGSIRRDLRAIVSEAVARGIDTSRLMFCSDGVNPVDMAAHGHIDHCVREAARAGMDPVRAYAVASRNAFDYYGMGRDLGGIGPGRLADIVLVDDLAAARARDVYVGGREVVRDRRLAAPVRARRPPAWAARTVRVGPAIRAGRPDRRRAGRGDRQVRPDRRAGRRLRRGHGRAGGGHRLDVDVPRERPRRRRARSCRDGSRGPRRGRRRGRDRRLEGPQGRREAAHALLRDRLGAAHGRGRLAPGGHRRRDGRRGVPLWAGAPGAPLFALPGPPLGPPPPLRPGRRQGAQARARRGP